MRASWKVDLKWVFALICVVSATVTSLLYSFQSLTAHDTATAIFTGAVGGFASDRISDEEYAALQAAAAQNPGVSVTLGGINNPVPASALPGLTKQEAVKLALTPVAEANYEHGPSSRFGRIGTPGLLLVIATVPSALFWVFLSSRVETVTPEESVFIRSIAEAFDGPASDNATAFLRLAVAGVVLITVAVVGHVAWPFAARWWDARRAAARAAAEEAAPVPPPGGLPTP
jgi:hypothetical protein